MDWTQATKELSAPLNSAHVKERSQSGRQLSYIEGWWAISEANRIFGYDGWLRETVLIQKVAEHERQLKSGMGWSVSYIAKVKVTVGSIGGGLVREGVGAGHGMDKDLGAAHESAIKEAETDAMKRALMTFGNPFGLALYDKTQAMVTDEPVNGNGNGHALNGNPDRKGYKTAATTPKALEARESNAFWNQCITEIRSTKTRATLRDWRAIRGPEVDKLMPAEWVPYLEEEYEKQRMGLPP